MFKTIFIIVISIIVVFIVVMIGRANWAWFSKETTRQSIPIDVFTSNGSLVNPTGKSICNPACLEAYPAGSQWAGYYYCRKNCGGDTFNRLPNPYFGPIFPSPPPPPPPHDLP